MLNDGDSFSEQAVLKTVGQESGNVLLYDNGMFTCFLKYAVCVVNNIF
jgi:hypothetical protein